MRHLKHITITLPRQEAELMTSFGR